VPGTVASQPRVDEGAATHAGYRAGLKLANPCPRSHVLPLC